MLNYHFSVPKRTMSFKIFYPRKRGLILKIFAFFTFVGFISLWFKSDHENNNFDSEEREKNSINFKAKSAEPIGGNAAQMAKPDDQIIHINEIPDHKPVKDLPPDKNILAQPNMLNPNRINKVPIKIKSVKHNDIEERMRAEKMFAEDEKKIVPGLGELGKGVRLTGEEAKLAEEVQKKEAFNLILSDKISLNRSVPDSRDPL